MMIRERKGAHKSTVLLIRVSWDKARKRSVQRVLGSFPSYASSLPPDLAGTDSELTEAEKVEATAWIATRQASLNLDKLPLLASIIIRNADQLASALEDPERADAAMKDLDHLSLYRSLDRLAKALRRHKLARAPRVKKNAEPEPSPEPPATELSA